MDMPNVKLVRPQPEVLIDDLMLAYLDVLKRCDMYEHHTITRERLSTRERMSRVMLQLQENQFMAFHALFDLAEGRMGVVVTFLAMMELVKEKLVKIVQVQEFGPIHVILGGQDESPNQELAL
jgi:segregation and condensation protein A